MAFYLSKKSQIIQSFHVCQYCAIESGLAKNCQFWPPGTSAQVKHVSVCNYVSLESCSAKCRCLIACSKEAVPAMFFQPDWLFLRAARSCFFLHFFFACSQLATKCYYGPHLGRFCQICLSGMKDCIGSEGIKAGVYFVESTAGAAYIWQNTFFCTETWEKWLSW